MKKTKVKDEEFARMKKVHNDLNKYVDKDFHFYLSYASRVTLIFIAVVVLGFLSYYFFNKSFSREKKETLNYEIKTSLDYDVVLFENPLGITNNNRVDSYLSELVNDISNNIHYEYVTDKEVNVNAVYSVDVMMQLENKETKEVFYTNTYPLIEEVKATSKNSKTFKFDQNVQLDYDFYNDKAKEMEQLATGDVTGKLIIKMYVTLNTKYEGFAKNVEKKDVVEVKVPLLSSQVSSTMVSKQKINDKYVENAKPELVNESMLYSGIALLIIDTMFLLSGISFIFKSTPKKSKYCRLRDGLLAEHDSIIVNARKMPDIKGKNMISCYSFGELLDAQKILDKPIIYYETVKDQKCTFFIIGDDDIYEYTLKECDVEF